MARRPDPAEFDRPLTEAELKERMRRLSLLSPHHVQMRIAKRTRAVGWKAIGCRGRVPFRSWWRHGRCCGSGASKEIQVAGDSDGNGGKVPEFKIMNTWTVQPGHS